VRIPLEPEQCASAGVLSLPPLVGWVCWGGGTAKRSGAWVRSGEPWQKGGRDNSKHGVRDRRASTCKSGTDRGGEIMWAGRRAEIEDDAGTKARHTSALSGPPMMQNRSHAQ